MDSDGAAETNCPICLQPLTDAEVQALVACGHTLHLHCARELVRAFDRRSPYEEEENQVKEVTCPCCRGALLDEEVSYLRKGEKRLLSVDFRVHELVKDPRESDVSYEALVEYRRSEEEEEEEPTQQHYRSTPSRLADIPPVGKTPDDKHPDGRPCTCCHAWKEFLYCADFEVEIFDPATDFFLVSIFRSESGGESEIAHRYRVDAKDLSRISSPDRRSPTILIETTDDEMTCDSCSSPPPPSPDLPHPSEIFEPQPSTSFAPVPSTSTATKKKNRKLTDEEKRENLLLKTLNRERRLFRALFMSARRQKVLAANTSNKFQDWWNYRRSAVLKNVKFPYDNPSPSLIVEKLDRILHECRELQQLLK